jgi:hypothetical protein
VVGGAEVGGRVVGGALVGGADVGGLVVVVADVGGGVPPLQATPLSVNAVGEL